MSILSRFLALLIATTAAGAQQERRQVPTTGNMRPTDSESLWTGRFSDCNFRYYVVIPNAFVAHGIARRNDYMVFYLVCPTRARLTLLPSTMNALSR